MMGEVHRKSAGLTTSTKSPSPKSNSPNDGTPAMEYMSNREQKKSEERQDCASATDR
jgi:hypothetical protein